MSQDFIQPCSEGLPGQRLHYLSGQPAPIPDWPYWEEVSVYTQPCFSLNAETFIFPPGTTVKFLAPFPWWPPYAYWRWSKVFPTKAIPSPAEPVSLLQPLLTRPVLQPQPSWWPYTELPLVFQWLSSVGGPQITSHTRDQSLPPWGTHSPSALLFSGTFLLGNQAGDAITTFSKTCRFRASEQKCWSETPRISHNLIKNILFMKVTIILYNLYWKYIE